MTVCMYRDIHTIQPYIIIISPFLLYKFQTSINGRKKRKIDHCCPNVVWLRAILVIAGCFAGRA